MQALIRPLRQDDEPFLWHMLYYAAHMQEDGETISDVAKNNPGLQKYIQEWGRETDIGVLALYPSNQCPLGAAIYAVSHSEGVSGDAQLYQAGYIRRRGSSGSASGSSEKEGQIAAV